MPACVRQPPATFHTKKQNVYNRQVVELLTRTPEFIRLEAMKDQTQALRIYWVVGIAFLVIVLYLDAACWLTVKPHHSGNTAGVSLLGAAPVLVRQAQYALPFFMGYPLGALLLVPWLGWDGDIEDVDTRRVVLAHGLAAVGVALQPFARPSALFFPAPPVNTTWVASVLPILTHPAHLLRVAFPPLAAMLLCGLLFRRAVSAHWRTRPTLTLHWLWLPFLYGFATVFLWRVLHHVVATTTELGHMFKPGAVGAGLLTAVPREVLNVTKDWDSYRSWALESYTGLEVLVLALLFGYAAAFLMFPVARAALFPRSVTRWGVQLAGVSVLLYHLWSQALVSTGVSVAIAIYLATMIYTNMKQHAGEGEED